MSDLQNYIEKQMMNVEFREEHEATRAEFEIIRALIEKINLIEDKQYDIISWKQHCRYRNIKA